eukprot:CAMPEP_0202777170 /NCGR_PEP_ID=MMETSP1388-20130828/52117_1 /ASSEMBLY_ACC=CAM_ASM_000864 /TAXON_ID=37098 /ORGANISM="Isochrysis sp, Strain CCMP1244" /LENGTH=45 /DNA_ID= /DNA_START= /DNA_END= /DNA_ORIENTATION=
MSPGGGARPVRARRRETADRTFATLAAAARRAASGSAAALAGSAL